jgi:uncharacterized protein YjbI with pentapeptide repeats
MWFGEKRVVQAQKLDEYDFSGADFSKADVNGCTFNRTNLSNADFRGTNCLNADFRGAILDGMKIDEKTTNLRGAIFDATAPAYLLDAKYAQEHPWKHFFGLSPYKKEPEKTAKERPGKAPTRAVEEIAQGQSSQPTIETGQHPFWDKKDSSAQPAMQEPSSTTATAKTESTEIQPPASLPAH